MNNTIRARHETVNGRLKRFTDLTGHFQHRIGLHLILIHVVANVVQIAIGNGRPLIQEDEGNSNLSAYELLYTL